MKEKLRKICYDPKHPAGFASSSELEKGSGYSQAKMKKWLMAQPPYALHRQARKKYASRKYVVHDTDKQCQADLADVSLIANQNNDYLHGRAQRSKGEAEGPKMAPLVEERDGHEKR